MTNSSPYKKFLKENADYLYRLENNTYIVESIKLMYMDTPKTAGTSIKTRLAKLAAGPFQAENILSNETVAEMFIHDRSTNPLKPLTAYPENVQCEILFSDDWKRICVVRNPFERLFSAWFSKLLLRQPGYLEAVPGYYLPEKINEEEEIYRLFEEFVRYLSEQGSNSDPHWDLQAKLLFQDVINWGRVFKFEALQEELLEDTEYLGGITFDLEKLNVSGFSPDWREMSEETVEKIREIYREDFEKYDYPGTPPDGRAVSDTLVTYINAVCARNLRVKQLVQTVSGNRAEINILEHDKQALEHDRQKLAQTVRENRAVIDALQHDKLVLQEELRNLTDSRSWKVTQPLRKIMAWIRCIVSWT